MDIYRQHDGFFHRPLPYFIPNNEDTALINLVPCCHEYAKESILYSRHC